MPDAGLQGEDQAHRPDRTLDFLLPSLPALTRLPQPVPSASKRQGGLPMAYENIRVETRGKVALITLDRPKALNALNGALISELNQALDEFEANAEIGCV